MKKLYPTYLRFFAVGVLLCFFTGWPDSINAQIGFGDSNLNFNGLGDVSSGVTSLMYGPDGRLYVAEYPGTIKILTIERNGPNDYVVTNIESLTGVKDIPNHDDDGTACSGTGGSCNSRETTGITVAGTASNPIIYVTSSDFRIGAGTGGGGNGNDKNLDTNSGIITRLAWNGSSWDVVDLVRGLPRSEENHATNGLEFVTVNGTDYLIVASGGITNAGSPSKNFAYTCEYALSAAVLSINLDVLNAMNIKTDASGRKYLYDLPTLDDPTRDNANGITDPNHPSYDGVDVNDPFGGHDGLNQAMIVPGGPVQIFSPGFRNPYDLVVTEGGAVYVTDNGANKKWGGLPMNEGTANVNNDYDPAEPGSDTPTADGELVNNKDHLQLITTDIQNYNFGSFYGGHPNPIRANPNGAGLYTTPNQFGNGGAVFRTEPYDPNGSTSGSSSNPDVALPANWPPVSTTNAVEGDWRGPGLANPDGPNDNPITTWKTNTNGIDEYTASNFGGALKGNLMAGRSAGELYRVELNADGSLQNLTEGFEDNIGGDPLGVSCNSDTDAFPGTIWIGTLNGKIVVFEPDDYDSSGDSPTIAQQLPDLFRVVDTPDETIDLDIYFDDDQGTSNLTYSIESNSNPSLGATISTNILTLSYPSAPMFSDITVRATDEDTNYVEQTFRVSVADPSTVIYRVNAGGPELVAIDGEMNWEADETANNSDYLSEAASNLTFASSNMPVDSSVNQTTTPLEIYASERYDDTPGAPNLSYSFPVSKNGDYEIRLYMGNSFAGTALPGERIFDVQIEGTSFPDLSDIDLSGTYGHKVGTVITHTLAITDSAIDITFLHGTIENPLINAIEILAVQNNIKPTAIAEASPLSGEAPLEVAFSASNSTDDKGIISYLWDFKDGSPTSAEINPTHIFTVPDTYLVELTVTDAEGLTDITTIPILVTSTVNEAPVAVLSATPTSGVLPLEVTFTGSNSTDDLAVVSYSWDFKDGSPTSTLANPVHTFTEAGTYEAELTVADAEGLTDTATITIVVSDPENQVPVAIINANPTRGEAPLEVTFTASNSTDDKAVTSYLWDFDDGSPTSTEMAPTHLFNDPGTYNISLTVADAEGLTDTSTVTIIADAVSKNDIKGVLVVNPAKDVARVQIIDKGPGDRRVVRVYIHDSSGRLIASYSPDKLVAHGLFEIPIATLSNENLYFIGFKMSKGDPVTMRLVVRN